MIMRVLQTGTPSVWKLFKIGYCIRGNCTSDKYLLYKWSTRLQSMYNHIVGQTASVISPFYSLLPGFSVKLFVHKTKEKARNLLQGYKYDFLLFKRIPILFLSDGYWNVYFKISTIKNKRIFIFSIFLFKLFFLLSSPLFPI